MKSVKIVILNWNGAEMLPRFLPSVVANTPSVVLGTPSVAANADPARADEEWTVEVVVADNGSTDNSRELLARNFPNVTVLDLGRNWGFAEGYNRALRQLQADVFVLLNSDVETADGWLEPLLAVFDTRPQTAAVGPKLLSFSDKTMFEYAGASGGFIDALGYPFCRGRIMGTLETDRGQYNDRRRVMWVSGACLALRASVFSEVGELDGDFFAHQEEIDLCWRLQLAGMDVVVEPQSVVYHLGAGTLAPSPAKLYLNYRNNLAMLYKNLPAGSMPFVIAVRLLLNASSSVVYLAGGKTDSFMAVWRAHRDFFRMLRGVSPVGEPESHPLSQSGGRFETLRGKRRKIQSSKIAHRSLAGVYRGSILLRYLFGRRTFGKLRII